MNPNLFATADPWDLVAEGYADELDWLMGPVSDRAAELANLVSTAAVLDVACGPGTTTLRIAPRVSSVHAVDFSEAMIARLRHDIEVQGGRNVSAEVGDGQALPYDRGTFDAAFSMFGLMFFPDRARGFFELFRVLRPGGAAVVSSWAAVYLSSLMRAIFGALRAGDPSMPEPKHNPNSLEDPSVFEQELRAAGFADVRIIPHAQSIAVDDADLLWERMARSSAPLAVLRRKVGEIEWSARAVAARAWLRSNLEVPTTLYTTALLGVGRKPQSGRVRR